MENTSTDSEILSFESATIASLNGSAEADTSKETNCTENHNGSFQGTDDASDEQMASILASLPHELILYLCLFLSDHDLQQLKRASHLFRSLVIDKLLWHYITMKRNPRSLSLRFFNPSRPTRMQLVAMNILKSTPSQMNLARQVANG
jgi:hypothetical protein